MLVMRLSISEFTALTRTFLDAVDIDGEPVAPLPFVVEVLGDKCCIADEIASL